MTSSEDTIYSRFSECTVAPLDSIPTYEYLTELNTYLNSCSASVHSNGGCGTLGYLVLTAPVAVYALQSAIAFVPPVNPGATLILPDPAPTAAVIGELTREHSEVTRCFREYHNVDKACKKVIPKLVLEVYFRSLKNRYTGYNNVTTLTILTHLWTEYGTLTEDMVQANDKKLREPISGETHFEELLMQIEDAQEVVAIQNPYTPAQIISIAFTLIQQTGYYDQGCREWKRKPPDEKTWDNFKLHFAREFKESRDVNQNTRTNKFAANAVAMEQANAAMICELTQDHTDALANLATATNADRGAMATLTRTNATLTASIISIQAKLTKALEEIVRLKAEKPPPTTRYPDVDLDPVGYCWSHGYKVKLGHNSKSCGTKKNGHKNDATRADTMGGKQFNKDWIP